MGDNGASELVDEYGIKLRRRSALFNSEEFNPSAVLPVSYSTLASGASSTTESSYEKILKVELDSWAHLLHEKNRALKENKKNILSLDYSLLTKEQIRYLEKGINLEKYLSEINKFSSLAELYIQRKSFLAQRYQAVLVEARAQFTNKALDAAERKLLSGKIKKP